MSFAAADHRLAAPARASANGVSLDERALGAALRALLCRGHGPARGDGAAFALGLAEVATVLWTRFLRFDAADPTWPDRDRVAVAAEDDGGLLAAVRTLCGETDACEPDGPHETLAGACGQGFGVAVGLALAERLLAARFGRSLVDHRTWVLASVDELARGLCHEAAAVAGALRLGKLTVLAAEGAAGVPADAAGADDLLKLFAPLGWATKRVDGADPYQIVAALAYAVRSARPTLILCRAEGRSAADAAAATPDGAIRPEVARAWAEAGRRGARERLAWRRRHQRSPLRDEFDRAMAGRLPETWRAALESWKAQAASERAPHATRAASRHALEALAGSIPELVCAAAGRAEPPARTATPPGTASFPGSSPRHLAWGAREAGMAAATAGLALHGGLVPCGEASLAACGAIRPALRAASLLRRRAIHVLTEGDDGAAALALGELAALRAIPNLFVFRPADPVEVAEAWALATAREDGPSVLVVADTVRPTVRANHTAENLSARGGYVLAEAAGPRQATLIASGTEVAVALAARDVLQAQGVAVAVVSLPCFELFAAQEETWRAVVLGGALRVGIEFGIPQGWERWLGLSGLFVGPDPVLAPPHAAGPHGRRPTPEGVAQAVLRRLS